MSGMETKRDNSYGRLLLFALWYGSTGIVGRDGVIFARTEAVLGFWGRAGVSRAGFCCLLVSVFWKEKKC
jgi:hypothetical protein